MLEQLKIRKISLGISAVAILVGVSGCGKGVDAGVSATFAMGKTSATSFASLMAEGFAPHFLSAPGGLLGVRTPTTYYSFQAADSFQVKLLAAYLAEDVDSSTQNNIGKTEMIYLNPGCNENITTCEADQITTFFEFNQSESALNAQLNAQSRTVAAGEYKYVRLELCKNIPTLANMKFTVNSLAALELISGRCSMNSGNDGNSSTLVPMSPPITITEGQSVQIRLEYNINRFIEEQTGLNSSSSCRQDAGANKSYCNYGYFFRPSVTVL